MYKIQQHLHILRRNYVRVDQAARNSCYMLVIPALGRQREEEPRTPDLPRFHETVSKHKYRSWKDSFIGEIPAMHT